MAKPIWEQPNHKHYGPIRRMWVVLAQLDLLAWAEANFAFWAEEMVRQLESGMEEASACRFVLWNFYHAGAR